MKWPIFKKETHLTTGALGEKIACNYLKAAGYKILVTNYFNKNGRRIGEIDIVAMKELVLIFVEVKTNTLKNNATLIPEQNITSSKLHKLNKIAQVYLKENNYNNHNYQFDAISIILNQATKKASLRHLKNIFI